MRKISKAYISSLELLKLLLAVCLLQLPGLASMAAGSDWPQHGPGHQEQRFSPLSDINQSNVARPGTDWYMNILNEKDVEAVHAFLTDLQHKLYAQQQDKK